MISGGGARLVYLLAILVLPSAARAEQQVISCKLELIGSGTVRRVIDGRTFELDDRREVRLAAIETPALSTPSEAYTRANSGLAARAALGALLGENEIVLERLGAATDRHGRLVAHAFVTERPGTDAGRPRLWVQQVLLAQGLARVAARVGDFACAASLLAAETEARAARLGLWSDPHYVMRRAEKPAEILAQRGHFTLVEGKVVSVRESGGTIYVNFGRRWSEDFTVTVAKRSERAFADAGLELRKLAGQYVRVRGHVEERGGPWIEAMNPEQIELAGRN